MATAEEIIIERAKKWGDSDFPENTHYSMLQNALNEAVPF